MIGLVKSFTGGFVKVSSRVVFKLFVVCCVVELSIAFFNVLISVLYDDGRAFVGLFDDYISVVLYGT